MKQRDIIITGLQDFNSEIGSNAVNLAREFAKHHRVLYVNYPLDRLTRWRHRNHSAVKQRLDVIKNRQAALRKVQDNLWVCTPAVMLESISKIPVKWLFDKLLYINNKRYAGEVRKAIDKLQVKDYLLFEDSDLYRTLYFKELLKPDLFLYYSRDNIVETPYYKKHGARIEAQMMKKADAVVCNSAYLAHLAHRFNSNSFDVGQGVETAIFEVEPKQKPAVLKDAQKPVIGYIGVLNAMRLDVHLLEQVARQNKQWLFVLVGPEDAVFRTSKLHNMENVIFTGKQPYDALPSYLHAFDVAINPQIVNNVTIGNYPRKIDEYLAAEKPVVAIKTEAMKMFADTVFLAGNADEFSAMCARALEAKDRDRAKRRRVAHSHSWQNSAQRIYEVIENLDKQKKYGSSRAN